MDPTARIEWARGAAAGHAGAGLRGGGLAGDAQSGAPGAIWDRVWPWSSIAAWVIHLGCELGLGRSGARSSAIMAARGGEVHRWGWFGPCRCWVSAGKGPGNTRKMRLALGYALCGLVRSAAVLDRRRAVAWVPLWATSYVNSCTR